MTDSYTILTSETDGLPRVTVVNQSLIDHPGRINYSWHLSVIIWCEELAENGMPTNAN